MDKAKELVRRYQLILFFVLAYAITWGVWIPVLRLYFQEEVSFVAVFSPWGAFGPALAGILITRFMHSEMSDRSRRASLSAFLLGLVVSAFVHILSAWMQARSTGTGGTVVGVTLVGLIAAIPPALVISSAFSRNEAVSDYLHSLVEPRGSAAYYLFALLLSPAISWVGSLISEAFGQAALYDTPPLYGWDAVRIVLITFISQFFYANALGEEVGWRGFALPRLQARHSPLVASLVIAPAWFAWHLPLKLLNPDEIPYLFYGLTFVPSSILLTWVFNRTNGSILAVGIAHAAGNVSGKLLFPASNAWLVLRFVTAAILVLIDRMWDRSTLETSSIVHRVSEQEPSTG